MCGRICKHPPCTCSVDLEGEYCSPLCARSAGAEISEMEGCPCGHLDCLGDAGARGDEALERHVPDEPPEGGL